MSGLRWLLVADGAAFAAIGLVVLAFPSPRPTLTREPDAATLVPLTDTRRLLASQFLGAGLLALLLGALVQDVATLRWAAAARVVTLLTVIGVNVSQQRNGAWKPGPLNGLIGLFGLLCAGYLTLVLSTAGG